MCRYYAGVYLCRLCCDLLLCDCVWVCVYVDGVVDVVCFLGLGVYGCIVSLFSGCVGCCVFCLICDA